MHKTTVALATAVATAFAVVPAATADKQITDAPVVDTPRAAAKIAAREFATLVDGHVSMGRCAKTKTKTTCRARVYGPESCRFRVVVRERDIYFLSSLRAIRCHKG